jgi:uncharacterized protein involved in exopolysaccharide biosynthesis
MIENRVLTMDDYLAMLRRRLKVILIPTFLAPAIGFAISYAFPAKYTSRALVLVQDQKVPQGYVAPVVTEDLSQRVATLEQEALGADRLRPLIEKLNQQGILHSSNVDAMIDEIRDSVALEPVEMVMVPNPVTSKGTSPRPGLAGPQRPPQIPGFNLDYTAATPHEAQAICAGITDIILQENFKEREQVAQNTTDFLARQVDEAKRNLDDLDAKLADFKKKYIGQLPGDEDTNLKLLSTLNSQLDSYTQALARAQQDKTYNESLLAQQLAIWNASRSDASPETLQKQLAAAQANLFNLKAIYTDDHPDVIRAKKEVADLEKKLHEADAAAAKPSADGADKTGISEPLEIQQLRRQVHQDTDTIAQAAHEQKNLQDQIKLLQSRVALSPGVEQQYKQLTRDYDTAQKFYDDLLAKKSQSEMQTAMEREQQGEQMQLQIPADLPNSPSFPNRLLFAGGGLGVGFALGLGVALFLEMRDKSLRNEDDVIAALQLPVLSQLPWVKVEAEAQNGNGERSALWKRRSEQREEKVEA